MHSYVSNVEKNQQSFRYAVDVFMVAGASLFLALMAQFSLPLWFSPVPISLQTLAVMLIGAFLGSKKGPLAILLYLFEGALGLPFFVGGKAGLICLLGPTGGYMFAFVLAAFLIGYSFEKGWMKRSFQMFLVLCLSSLLIQLVGASWLGFYVGPKNAWLLGVYPFVIGAFIKTVVAFGMIRSARCWLK